MKRKVLGVLLAATLTVSALLTGCGNNKETQPSESGKDASVEQSSTQKSENVETKDTDLEAKTIQLWLPGDKKQDSEKVWEAFNEKLQEYVPNTTVEISLISFSDYGEKYKQMLASGETVDLAWVASWVTGNMDEGIANGNMMPLDDLLEEYGSGIKEALGDQALDLHRTADGKLYYLFSWQGLYNNRRAYTFPTELTKLAGEGWLEKTQELVTKWWNTDSSLEDFQAVLDQIAIYCEALKENGKLYGGISPTDHFGWNYGTRLRTDGVPSGIEHVGLVTGDNTFTVTDAIATDYFRLFAKNMADFYKKGYIRSDIGSFDRSAASLPKNNEYTPNTWIMGCGGALLDNDAELQSFRMGTEISDVFIEEKGTLGKGDATAMSIPYCADEPERGMMVLNAIYSQPDLYQLLIWGMEGENYTKNSDGTITLIKSDSGEKTYGIDNWIIGTCRNGLTEEGSDPDYYNQVAEAEKTAYINPFLNFAFDQSNVSDIVSSLTAIDKEYYDMVYMGYTGDEWEATLDKWIAERKAAGVDTLIAEYQKQLDAYIKENNITSW